MSNTARALEDTFTTQLAAILIGVSVRPRNDSVPDDPDEQRIPAVIVTATKREDFLAIKHAGRIAEVCELSLECRAAGDTEIETLAGTANTALATALANLADDPETSGWLYLQLDRDGDERGFDGPTRTIALKYTARCLTA